MDLRAMTLTTEMVRRAAPGISRAGGQPAQQGEGRAVNIYLGAAPLSVIK